LRGNIARVFKTLYVLASQYPDRHGDFTRPADHMNIWKKKRHVQNLLTDRENSDATPSERNRVHTGYGTTTHCYFQALNPGAAQRVYFWELGGSVRGVRRSFSKHYLLFNPSAVGQIRAQVQIFFGELLVSPRWRA